MKKLLLAAMLAVAPMFANAATDMTDASLNQLLKEKKQGMVIVKMYTTWCPACKAMKPMFIDAEIRFAGRAEFAQIDLDKNPETASGIPAVPMLIFIKDGVPLTAVPGVPPSQEALDDLIERVLSGQATSQGK